MSTFYHYKQQASNDCGATCLRMIAGFHGRQYQASTLYHYCNTGEQGTSVFDLNCAAQAIGFRTSTVKLTCEQLTDNAPLPCILHWRAQHFVVLYDVREKDGLTYFVVADPALPYFVGYPQSVLEKFWISSDSEAKITCGIAILFEPTEKIHAL